MDKKNTSYQFLKDQPLNVDSFQKAFSSQFDIIKVQDISTPIPQKEIHCKSFTTGCIYHSNGEKIKLSERQGAHGGDHISTTNPIKLPRPPIFSSKLKGNTFFIGVWMNHYGHFITETLSRLWLHKSIKNYDNLVAFPFIFNHSIPITGYQSYLLHLLDIPAKKIKILRKPMRFENITVPEQG